MSAPVLSSPFLPSSPQFKRRASPPRYPDSPILSTPRHQLSSPGGPLRTVTHRRFLRLFIMTSILLPTLYVILGPEPSVHALEVVTREEGHGRDRPKEVLERVKQWGGSVSGKAQGGGLGLSGTSSSGNEVLLDLEEDLPLSIYDGGLAGYSVFTNLYLSDGALLFVEPESGSPEKPLPGIRQIMSGPKTNQGFLAADEDRWRVVDSDQAGDELGKRALYLDGTTYLFNDGPGPEGYLIYFNHFIVEAFLGATRVLAHILKSQKLLGDTDSVPLPKRIWFPRCGWKPSWRDERGENAWFLSHALPGAIIEDANGWEDRISVGLPLIFEKIIIVDRWAAHSSHGEVGKWGRMNADHPTLDTPRDYWSSMRRNVMRSVGVDGASDVGSRGLPVVVYIDSQTGSPKVKEEDRTALIEALKGLTDIAEVHVSRLAAMSKAEQVELMGRAEVVIGLHTNDLYGALWMPATPRSAIIEIFPEGGFDRAFELLAGSLNHQHFAIQNDKILTEAEWRKIGPKQLVDNKEPLPVDGTLIAKIVRGLLR